MAPQRVRRNCIRIGTHDFALDKRQIEQFVTAQSQGWSVKAASRLVGISKNTGYRLYWAIRQKRWLSESRETKRQCVILS